MGVPKYARFICERYPCLLEVLNEYQIPEFDNLYLDMNGIIHCCSHPNDADAHFRITEETIFKNIFLYVEILFRTIKPQKLFFMAVDGVAPRAKINQQRSRRFRSAKDAEMVEARAREKGEKIPEEARFDSNCITPGTEFMAKLTEQLKYFVTYKISTDNLWKKCKVILSGPEVPGEGEHKIMDYIRYMKAQPGYDSNTRHCLYGLDADLIMLSLCTHEPHFAVLREEVKYGRNQPKVSVPEKTKFCLLHISLLREYMEHEFSSVKDKLKFPFDVEKIIDDWILMGFLVGNDFIPHLPNLHISNGALPILYQAYMEVLPTLDGYINEAGSLNLERFEKFMERLSLIDVEHFAAHQTDLKYFEAKTGRRPNDQERTSYKFSKDSTQEQTPSKKVINKGLEALIQSTDEMLLGHSDEEEDLLETDSDNEMYSLEFLQHKRDYYMTKFDYEFVDADIMKKQAEAYVTAIQWNLHYYYDGCRSWSWFYPHHYAPYISDIKGFKDFKISFDIGKPFLPFQQLLAVLPAASRNLLPAAYQGLLTEEESPIIDYYPDEFKTDLNEKKQEWEAIVLIPFINEKKLIDAMASHNCELTPEEVKRNQHGSMSIIEYVEENLGTVTSPAFFPSIESHAKITDMDPSAIEVPTSHLIKGLCKGIKLSVYFPGYPTLQHIEHTAVLDKCKVKVFEQPSRGENMMITIMPNKSPSIEKLSSELLGKIIFVSWPHLMEAFVVGVSNGDRKFSLIHQDQPYCLENLNREDLKGSASTQWFSEARGVAYNYKGRFGINIGDIDTLIHAKPISGRRYILTSQGRMSLEKEWSLHPTCYAYQAIVRDIEVEKSGTVDHKVIADIYTPKSVCFMLGHPHYGAMGEVNESGINPKTGRVKVAMRIVPEINLDKFKAEQLETRMQYMRGSIAAQRLGISSHLLSRITGSIFVSPGSNEQSEKRQQNIGLSLKYNKRNEELPGYTRKVNGQWLYSSKSIGLIRNFLGKYPQLFERLAQSVGNDIFDEDDLFPNKIGELTQVIQWLKEQPFRTVDCRNCDWDGIDPDIIQKLEKEVDKYLENSIKEEKTLMMQVKPHLLFKPGLSSGNIPPDTTAKHFVFDRIIAIKENSCVPVGYKGTIVTVQGNDTDISNNTYDILFDKPFVGGISFSGKATNRRYKLLAAEFINISHGIRAEQNITRIGPINEKTNRKKQSNTSENNSQAYSSAFASFNKYDFFPVFNKDKQFHNQQNQKQQKQMQQQQQQQQQQQGQQQQQPQIRVMKKNNNLPQANLNSPVRNNEKKNEYPLSQKNTPGIPRQKNKIQHPDGPPPAIPVSSVDTSQNQSIKANEFQMLWNELHKLPAPNANQKPMVFPSMRPPVPPPQVPGLAVTASPQDPSAFLKAMLKIPDDLSSESSQSSVSASKKPFIFPPTPPAPPSTAPALVQQLFDHARQAKRIENMSYCARLLNHFQILGVGLPRYFYSSQKNMICAQIVLPDCRTFYSDLCASHESASENVATKVVKELNLENAPKPTPYFDLLPPDAWIKAQPPVNVQPIVSPRPFPDAQALPLRPQTNWNPTMPPHPPGFIHQMAPLRMNHVPPPRPPGKPEVKPELKQSTPFVPLQAQKKTRHRNQKETPQNSTQKPREGMPAQKPQKSKPKENAPKAQRDEKSAKENDQLKVKDNPPVQQKSFKTSRQRRSRIAANFGSSSAANGGEKQ